MQRVWDRTGGHNGDQWRPKHSWVLPSSGQEPYWDGNYHGEYHAMLFFFFFEYLFFTLNTHESVPVSEVMQQTQPSNGRH